MANLYENIPEMQARAQANEQRRKIAESLLVQSQDQVQPFVNTGRMVAPMSITQGLAQMLKAYYAGKGIKSANEGDKALASEHAAKAAEAIAAYKAQSQGVPERAPAPVMPVTGSGPPKPAAGPPVPEVPKDQRGAMINALANDYLSPGFKQAIQYGDTVRREDQSQKDLMSLKKEELEFKLNDAIQRSEDKRYTVDQNNATRLEIAQLTKALAAIGGGGGNPYFSPVQTGQGVMSYNNRTGQMEPALVNGKPVIGAAADPALQGNLAGAKAGGKVAGTAGAQAAIDLPRVTDMAEQSMQTVRELITHPGFSSAVGTTLRPYARFADGSKEADFMKRLGQVQGGAFLEAYKTLKGGGQITEIEGTKATDAITRMSKSQSEEEFKTAAKDYIEVIETGLSRARNAASSAPSAPTVPGQSMRFDAQGNPIQ